MANEALGNGDWINELISRQQPGWTLDREFYTDSQVFEQDVERIFLKRWLFAGHVSRIPNYGDYFLYNVAGESIILSRGAHGQVHALFNICRHRGSRVCSEEAGNAKKLVCPYHAWTYECDGALAAARHMPEDFDKSKFGLHRAHVRVLEGLIFICLAEEAPEFDAMARDIQPFLKPYQLERTRICERPRYEVKANWKLVAENGWECYHCPTTHPELDVVMSYVGAIDSPKLAEERRSLTRHWESQARVLGHPVGGVEPRPDTWWECKRIPIRAGFATQSQDGKPVAPLLGSLKAHDGGVLGVNMLPFIWFAICCDYAMLFRLTPIAPKLTEVEITWLVHENAVEGRDYDRDRVTWLWKLTSEEDWLLCENNQAGVNSRRYQPGPYSTIEKYRNDGFSIWYLNQLRGEEGRIEQAARVNWV